MALYALRTRRSFDSGKASLPTVLWGEGVGTCSVKSFGSLAWLSPLQYLDYMRVRQISQLALHLLSILGCHRDQCYQGRFLDYRWCMRCCKETELQAKKRPRGLLMAGLAEQGAQSHSQRLRGALVRKKRSDCVFQSCGTSFTRGPGFTHLLAVRPSVSRLMLSFLIYQIERNGNPTT